MASRISDVQLEFCAPMSSQSSHDAEGIPSPTFQADPEKGAVDQSRPSPRRATPGEESAQRLLSWLATVIPAIPATLERIPEKLRPSQFKLDDHKGILRLLFLLFIVAIPISITCFGQALHVGHPTSFPSDERASFTPGPLSRGTINIISACLSTIFTCVYVSLHLDVPDNQQGRLRAFKRKLCWMVINVISPELIAYVAVVEFLSAQRWTKFIRKRLPEAMGEKWTISQTFFVDMGGFKVRFGHEEDHDEEDDVILPTAFELYQWLEHNSSAAEHIDFKQIERDIDDKCKADWLAKFLTVTQASWLVVQSIVRAAKHQSVSELEVTTCAYVVCTLFAYTCWWYKPYSAQQHVLLQMPCSIGPPAVNCSRITPFNRLSFHNVSHGLDLIATIASGCIGALVGAIHCTLWNAEFANINGRYLWRICSITQIGTSLLMSLFLALASVTRVGDGAAECIAEFPLAKWITRKVSYKFLLVMGLFACFIQFCARIVIFILIGYSFWSLPMDVYKTTDWTWSWFPHIY